MSIDGARAGWSAQRYDGSMGGGLFFSARRYANRNAATSSPRARRAGANGVRAPRLDGASNLPSVGVR
eukprot:5256482-Pyramimonas_sp.AAC.1